MIFFSNEFADKRGLAQTLVITCGYVQRSQPMFLTMMAKSSYHTSGMSNRLNSSSARARFLGIAVGMAISKMADKPELQLKFDLEGDEADEAKWFQHLTNVDDEIGQIKDLNTEDKSATAKPVGSKSKSTKLQKTASTSSTKSCITEVQGPRIVEILDDSSDDDDLVAYDKPDSDPEDDTDDPTEINRNKPVAPVYIRDLIAGLRDSENYDRHALALSTAPSLIRRKANFGTEVIDHMEELATILVGLQDTYDLEKFAEKRQQALIAILLAKPAAMAQLFVRAFFSGDYSFTQRTAILTTLGLGARELAGLKDASTEDLVPPPATFPSKQLPPHLHTLYASNSSPSTLGTITSGVTKTLLSPIAAQAADSLTGPSILKVRTFSSRMEVEARRSKPIPNALAQIVAENFFFPLTGRWWMATRSSSSSNSVYTSPLLLPAYLQTLALLLQAAGPSTLALPQMTRELWALLLSLRASALEDKRVLAGLLFAFLMLLETNADKERLATEQGRELVETQEWVKMVFENLPGGTEGGDEERVRVLAAGVVVRCQQVVEKYQRRLVGSLMDY
jgi:telomere length regulation protein